MGDSSNSQTLSPIQIQADTNLNQNTSHVVFDHDDLEGGYDHNDRVPYRGAASVLDRVRYILGRFGKLTGMRIPGTAYASLSSGGRDALSGSRRMGGGIHQDGVFSNLNAKPDAMRSSVDPHDRGDDDDIVRVFRYLLKADDTLPPTYEVAAADTAPSYWESNVFGGSALVDSEGIWSENSTHVGEIPDMMQDGMMVGTIFAFCWNLFVSASFQFIGFILTFLLHSTHAAKYGSRVGLGASFVQYGLDMRLTLDASLARASQDDEDDEIVSMPSPGAVQRSRIGCDLLIAFGVFICVEACIKFMLLYRKSSRIVAEARRQEQQTLTIPDPENSSPSEVRGSYAARFVNWIRTGPVTMVSNILQNIQNAVSHDLSIFMGEPMAHTAEDYIIRPGYGFAQDPVIFSIHHGNTHSNMDDETVAHSLGLTNPFTGRVHDFDEEEIGHELRAVRFM